MLNLISFLYLLFISIVLLIFLFKGIQLFNRLLIKFPKIPKYRYHVINDDFSTSIVNENEIKTGEYYIFERIRSKQFELKRKNFTLLINCKSLEDCINKKIKKS